ncbi:uncharacterized protein [Dermacentor albipictus]|uniref:uncharacterized protein isoform X2 n=1 Tax=Dermacentor albipictus TaxID=60249 RepID=UPI0031FBA43C
MEGNKIQDVPTEHNKAIAGRRRLHKGVQPSEGEDIQPQSSSLKCPLERELLQSWSRFPVQERRGNNRVDGSGEQSPSPILLPRDLHIEKHRPCRCTVLLGGGSSILTASGALEEAQDLAEWEAFLTLLLRVHGCIRQVRFNIWTSSKSDRPFYRSLQMQDGCVVVDLQTAAVRQPSSMCGVPVYVSQVIDEGLPGTNMPRLIKIIKKMPFLDKLVFCVQNSSSGQRISRVTSKILGFGQDKETTKTLCVGASCGPFLHCIGGDERVAKTVVSLEPTMTPTKFTARELAGSYGAHPLLHVEVTYYATRMVHYHVSTLHVVLGHED